MGKEGGIWKRYREIIQKLVETNTMVVPRRTTLDVNVEAVHKVVGLPHIGDQEAAKAYIVANEVPKEGAMHQIKDVFDPHKRAQLIFNLHNIPFTARVRTLPKIYIAR